MSYILDAIKKSEHDKNIFQTIDYKPENKENKENKENNPISLWLIMLLILLAVLF